jgi:hypothetical protein
MSAEPPIPRRLGVSCSERTRRKADAMTLVWLAIWFVFDLVGDNEPLLFDPVNFWTGTLILAIALDFGSLHATPAGRGKRR